MVTRTTVPEGNEVRAIVSNTSPLRYQGNFRVAMSQLVGVSAITAKERWPHHLFNTMVQGHVLIISTIYTHMT